jgi:hypothetical protein
LTPESRSAALTRCFTDRAGFNLSDGLAALILRNEARSGSLIATARAFASRGFAAWIAPAPRPLGYMANGPFQGKLLSVYETKLVSLTHQMTQMSADKTERNQEWTGTFTNNSSALFVCIRVHSWFIACLRILIRSRRSRRLGGCISLPWTF